MIDFRVKTTLVAGVLLAMTACADLDVVNQNDPDASRALATPGDVESLIAGSYRQWFDVQSSYNSTTMILSNVAFQHSAYPANFGMVEYSKFPRIPIVNSSADQFYAYFEYPWVKNYRALAAIRDGLIALDGGVDLGDDELRARAYSKFVQGLTHGNLAVLYDQAFIVDETTNTAEAVEASSAAEVLEAALGYFDEAIALATGATFEIPTSWMSVNVSAEQLVRLAHSYKARYRASVARTPAERAAVDWNAVLADIEDGIDADWEMDLDGTNWWSSALYYSHLFGWGQMSYFVNGMADQSGKYQTWVAMPITEKEPNLGSDTPFLIDTPDERYPQGATIDEQIANPGTIYQVPATYGNQWQRPDRGSFRWSYYRDYTRDTWNQNDGPVVFLEMAEMDLLAAEAYIHLGQPALAAPIINEYRTAAGLSATDAAGTNADCVPKLANGTCGDLMEMMKWEKRHETLHAGEMQTSWYFDGRGWGDLYEGSFLELPVPALDAETLGLQIYTFGGSEGASASPGSSYGWEN